VITGIVLAAGASRRMGRAKALLPWGETTVLGQVLANLSVSRVDDVVVVTGDRADAVAGAAEAARARAVHNPDWATTGMAASLAVGLRAVPGDCEAALVILADQPMIGPGIIDAVVAGYRAHVEGADGAGDGRAIVAAAHRGRRGHPVIFGRVHFAALLALPADASPRAVLVGAGDGVRLVDVGSDVVLGDLDTPDAYERWRALASPIP